MTPPIILASTSPYRRALLERLRVEFSTLSPEVDEEPCHQRGLSPVELCQQLARAKADAVAREHPSAIVIGSDQVPSVHGEILTKPGSEAAARDQLARLSGQEHLLHTAVAITHEQQTLCHLDVSRFRMRRLTAEEIARYVAADQPLDCAGSYKIESLGISLFESIESDDFSAIVGLPLLFVAHALRTLGIPVP